MAILNKYNFYQITPKDCSNMTFEQSFQMLKKVLGEKVLEKAMDISYVYPSPIIKKTDTSWCKSIKIIGVNPRLTKTFWGIVKYAMTFPEEGIHIMPLWTTGDKGSLYVQTSWRVNHEFLDSDLLNLGYDTPEKQLKLVVNMLHAMGKIVGFDAMPHVDNFSEITLLNPKYFEWIKLNKAKTQQLYPPDIDYNLLYRDVENIIIETLKAPDNLYSLSETDRDSFIFPTSCDRTERRIFLMKKIRAKGYEPIPVTEHAPMKPVVFKRMQKSNGGSWAVFDVENKSGGAKIIGCISPYKWYKTDNQGLPVENEIEQETWDYFSEKICSFQREFNFDFMRADMAHNQISHAHSSLIKQENNEQEFWAYVKDRIRQEKPYFSTFAEAFYGTYYINGYSDMINKKADIVLGNMNFKYLNKDYINNLDDFLNPFRKNFPFYPCVCVFSNDGDLKEHSKYFQTQEANEARYFISLFIDLPSYMGIGYETKTLKPVKKNEFSGDYVKNQKLSYLWGDNLKLFEKITQMRMIYAQCKRVIETIDSKLLQTDNSNSIAWQYDNLIFLCNLNTRKNNVKIKLDTNKFKHAELIYSTSDYDDITQKEQIEKETLFIDNIYIGECAVYELK